VTTEDYYASTRIVGGRLAGLGFTKRQAELEDAITSGATATEILMKVRWILQSVASASGLPREMAAEIEDLEQRIQKALA
jgi:hypothetical protein